LSKRSDSIVVRLVDKTNQGPEEEAEILLDDISPDDLPLVQAGAVFYWAVGYYNSSARQRIRQSTIVFRRLPTWTDAELGYLEEKVDKQTALFRWA
jgi:hypothetical protein